VKVFLEGYENSELRYDPNKAKYIGTTLVVEKNQEPEVSWFT